MKLNPALAAWAELGLVLLMLGSNDRAVDAAVDCKNSPNKKVFIAQKVMKVKKGAMVMPAMALKVACSQVTAGPNYCMKKDNMSGKSIKTICRNECHPGCKGGTTTPPPSPAPVTTSNPPPSPAPVAPAAPTPGAANPPPSAAPFPVPTVLPTPAPAGAANPPPLPAPFPAPTVLPTPAPIATGGSVVGGPFIQPKNANKIVTLPQPDKPADLNPPRANCPHDAGGLLDWHNPGTWGGSVPGANQNVNLPGGSKVVVTQSIVETLGIVTIPADSELIIGEAASGITIDAKGFNVFGRLTAGSETCLIDRPITITLHGNRPNDLVWNVPAPHVKGISVEGGTLNLHGKRYFRTWARLAKTVMPGDTSVILQHSVNWKPGQKVVVLTSILQDHRAYHQNEIMTVASVHPSPPPKAGAVVHLTEAVKYKHIANEFYQVEVGLLSRMIVVQGSESSEPSDPDPLTCRTNYPFWHFFYNLSQPCMGNYELTGYGGHIIVHEGGIGHVQGVELFRMGQTNALGRYPMHFHLLNDCPTCYFKHSSVHHSYYRCISIHATNNITVTENVGYDVIGYCYYFEDGVEENNTMTFNLGAHIHMIGPSIPTGGAQNTDIYNQDGKLTLPADTTASAFYLTNVRNYINGNACSGGWSCYAFPSFPTPTGPFRQQKFRPANAPGLELDGNTAHSTGFWWGHAGAFYLGGALYYVGNSLQYNPGRSFNFGRDDRRPCHVNACEEPINDCTRCPEEMRAPLRMTNSKAFLTAGVGVNSWSGRMEVIGYESYDSRLAIESLSPGFWISDMFVSCRTGESLGLEAPATATKMEGSAFYWYDTAQTHVITRSTFQNCGYRSENFTHYSTSPTRGCGDDEYSGCEPGSTVFGFLTHSDQNCPEVMQGTRQLTFEECGRRFKFRNGLKDSVSGRIQNWKDVDGSASGLGVPTMIGSGLPSVRSWWGVDDDVQFLDEGPVSFIKQNNGPHRAIGHVTLKWHDWLHNQVGGSMCQNSGNAPCDTVGYVRHLGHKFSPNKNPSTGPGYPVTANPDTAGPTGGFGWLIKLNEGAPRFLEFYAVEVEPDSPLFVSIAYPPGTSIEIEAKQSWCWEQADTYTCEGVFTSVSSVEAVRTSTQGNVYFMDNQGVVTFRVMQLAHLFTGNPDFFIPTYETVGRDGINPALRYYERDGVLLPEQTFGTWIQVRADCSANGVYCAGSVVDYDPDVCASGYEQVAYDKCCQKSNPSSCMYPDGSTS